MDWKMFLFQDLCTKHLDLDTIASIGVNGLMDPVSVGWGCGSDTAHLSIIGYDPRVISMAEARVNLCGLDWPWHLGILLSRNVVKADELREIGFIVYSIGNPLDPCLKDMPAIA
ncbi:cofactor-independent phosphoglycerate mutase [Tanacetum coccineum]